jgi:hypothetical protein
MMEEFQSWVSTFLQLATAIGIIVGILQNIKTRKAAVNAADNAEAAAIAVNVSSAAHAETLNAMAADIKSVEVNTNSITERLEKAAFAAGSASGIADEVARRKDDPDRK